MQRVQQAPLRVADIVFDVALSHSAGFRYNHTRIRFGCIRSTGRRVAVKEVSLARAAREAQSQRAADQLRQVSGDQCQAGTVILPVTGPARL